MSGLIISDVGQEGLHLRAGSSDNVVRGVAVHRTGLADPEFGEGVYVGSAESNWCRYTACEPDRSDRNVLDSLTVSDTTAEAVDVKEGTSDGVIRDSTLSIAADAVVDSAVDLKGSGWRLASSIVTGGAAAVSVHVIVEPWGARNTVIDSDLRAGPGESGSSSRVPHVTRTTSWGAATRFSPEPSCLPSPAGDARDTRTRYRSLSPPGRGRRIVG